MKDKYILPVLVLVVAVLVGLTLLSKPSNDHYILQSKRGCCSITVNRISEDQYVLTWKDHETGESYETLAEVEYPDEDYTPEEELQHEVEWTLNEMMDTCYTTHGI